LRVKIRFCATKSYWAMWSCECAVTMRSLDSSNWWDVISG
jgi:hypothetical protein